MTPRIEVLGLGGHISLEWNPDDPADIERARADVQRLTEAGYAFFITETEPADAISAGRGKLIVKRTDDPVTDLSQPAAADDLDLPSESTPEAPRRRGRPSKNEAPAREAVAVRRMGGG